LFNSLVQIQLPGYVLRRYGVPVCLSFTSNIAEGLSVENSLTSCCFCNIWTSKNHSACRSGQAAGLIAPGGRVLQCTPRGLVCASLGALSALSERPSIPNQMLREPSRKAKPWDILVTYRGKTSMISSKLPCLMKQNLDILFRVI
jgi:hypothetical protein